LSDRGLRALGPGLPPLELGDRPLVTHQLDVWLRLGLARDTADPVLDRVARCLRGGHLPSSLHPAQALGILLDREWLGVAVVGDHATLADHVMPGDLHEHGPGVAHVINKRRQGWPAVDGDLLDLAVEGGKHVGHLTVAGPTDREAATITVAVAAALSPEHVLDPAHRHTGQERDSSRAAVVSVLHVDDWSEQRHAILSKSSMLSK